MGCRHSLRFYSILAVANLSLRPFDNTMDGCSDLQTVLTMMDRKIGKEKCQLILQQINRTTGNSKVFLFVQYFRTLSLFITIALNTEWYCFYFIEILLCWLINLYRDKHSGNAINLKLKHNWWTINFNSEYGC